MLDTFTITILFHLGVAEFRPIVTPNLPMDDPNSFWALVANFLKMSNILALVLQKESSSIA
jgi:hypothetical protein